MLSLRQAGATLLVQLCFLVIWSMTPTQTRFPWMDGAGRWLWFIALKISRNQSNTTSGKVAMSFHFQNFSLGSLFLTTWPSLPIIHQALLAYHLRQKTMTKRLPNPSGKLSKNWPQLNAVLYAYQKSLSLLSTLKFCPHTLNSTDMLSYQSITSNSEDECVPSNKTVLLS